MAILFQNVTAVLMDDAGTVLKGAFVAVEGDKILSPSARSARRAPLTRWSTAWARS